MRMRCFCCIGCGQCFPVTAFHSGPGCWPYLCAESVQASEGSTFTSTTKSRRTSSGCVSVSPWVLQHSDLRVLKPIGEGAYSKVGQFWLLSSACVLAFVAPMPAAEHGRPRCTSCPPLAVAGAQSALCLAGVHGDLARDCGCCEGLSAGGRGGAGPCQRHHSLQTPARSLAQGRQLVACTAKLLSGRLVLILWPGGLHHAKRALEAGFDGEAASHMPTPAEPALRRVPSPLRSHPSSLRSATPT